MKKLWIIIPFLIILTIFCINFSIQDINQDNHDKPIGEIRKGNVVGQTFISNYNGLCAVDVCLATYIRTNTEDIIFHLRPDPKSKEDIITIVVNARNIEDNKYHRFNFNPIENSKGKSYYFFIESPKSVPGNAITAWYNTKDAYGNGSAYINHEEIEGDIQFKTYYETDFFDVVAYFCGRASRDKPFFVFYFSLIVILIFLLVKSRFPREK